MMVAGLVPSEESNRATYDTDSAISWTCEWRLLGEVLPDPHGGRERKLLSDLAAGDVMAAGKELARAGADKLS